MRGVEPRFSLGVVVGTTGALDALVEAGVAPGELLARHASGDWGDLDAHDRRENERAIKTGARIFSAYETSKGGRVWIITEADRSSTCILRPEDY